VRKPSKQPMGSCEHTTNARSALQWLDGTSEIVMQNPYECLHWLGVSILMRLAILWLIGSFPAPHLTFNRSASVHCHYNQAIQRWNSFLEQHRSQFLEYWLCISAPGLENLPKDESIAWKVHTIWGELGFITQEMGYGAKEIIQINLNMVRAKQ